MTSVYISNGGMLWSLPNALSTALAMFPTPDCKGRKVEGMMPFRRSAARNSATFCPILSVTGSGSWKPRASSGIFVSTIPTIFSGSTWMYGNPMRSLGFTMGIGRRKGGRSISYKSCIPMMDLLWAAFSSTIILSASRAMVGVMPTPAVR